VERTGASSKKTERLRGLLTNGTTFSAAAAAAAAVLFGVVMAGDIGYVCVEWRVATKVCKER
jgi:hypothetical protein